MELPSYVINAVSPIKSHGNCFWASSYLSAMAGRMYLGVCTVLMAIAVVKAASGESASVVVGLAKCADSTRKNMKNEAAFKGLQVAIKCKNNNGEYESKAVGEVQSSGTFSVPLAADLHSSDCFAQLHSTGNVPCPGQEPSKIVAMSGGTFVAIPGKTLYPSAECASATICGFKKDFFDHFHKIPVPEHQPAPEYHPVPEHKPAPEYHPPTPEYHPPTPEYHSPTPVYGHPTPTPIYHPPVQH
ncbi:proline-rich protein 4-like [Phragmites australis]|uniref:proline-rich protein 4-like n=1 Tax=Phragmites australis TaxID=29695 RepID=UPI002D791042|nr:proline-rich protein 4-like [Phragmites australis]